MAIMKRSQTESDLFGRRFSDIMDEFFNDAITTRQNRFIPNIDLSETDNQYLLEVQLPGIKKEDISVNLENDILTISGERKFEDEQQNKQFHRIETRYGAFTRSIPLPGTIKQDSVNANYNDGILSVSVDKSEESMSKKIEVK